VKGLFGFGLSQAHIVDDAFVPAFQKKQKASSTFGANDESPPVRAAQVAKTEGFLVCQSHG